MAVSATKQSAVTVTATAKNLFSRTKQSTSPNSSNGATKQIKQSTGVDKTAAVTCNNHKERWQKQ